LSSSCKETAQNKFCPKKMEKQRHLLLMPSPPLSPLQLLLPAQNSQRHYHERLTLVAARAQDALLIPASQRAACTPPSWPCVPPSKGFLRNVEVLPSLTSPKGEGGIRAPMPSGVHNPKHCRVDRCTEKLRHDSPNVYCRTCIGAGRQGPHDHKGLIADQDLVDIVASAITTHDLRASVVSRWFKAGLEKLSLCGVCQCWTLNWKNRRGITSAAVGYTHLGGE
jgi:hypothetical protein